MSDKNYDNKRKCVRLDFRTDINFNIVETSDEETPKKLFRAVGKNVGAEGMLLTSNEELAPGVILDLEVLFPEKPNSIFIKGEVRWCLPIKEEPGNFDIGVRFQNVDKNSAFCLIEYVCGHLGQEVLKRLKPNESK